jgi:signal transduction histidine kinase
VVGVLFVNYRSTQNFDMHYRLIDAFAWQATSAIVNARLLEQNENFWELRRRDSLALALSHVIPGLAHNAGNLLESMTLNYLDFAGDVNDVPGDMVPKRLCKKFIRDLKRLLRALGSDFKRLKEYRAFDKFKEERCDVSNLIDNALRMLKKPLEDVEIKWPRRPPLPPIFCDKSQIQHIFLNLFLNSIKAMEKTRRKEISICTSFDRKKSYVKIDVTDNGRGIPPAARGKIFEPAFSTSKAEGGSGYGLSVSRYIARNHHGSIDFVQPSNNQGATFSIILPVRRRKNDHTRN